MGRCNACKYWGRYFDSACGRIEHFSSPEQMVRDGYKFGVSVWASDDSGIDFILLTAPDFGCVEFKEKDG